MFVQVIQGHVSDADCFRRNGDRWTAEVRPGATGFLGSTRGITAEGTAFIIARFESEAAARQNSERPEQGAFWAEAQQCFDGPVTFAESSDVQSLMSGGSDAAGFVQLMKGSMGDRKLMTEMDELFTDAAPAWRPDVLGGLRAWVTPTDYIEVMYFASEAEARANEQKEPPASLVARMADFETLMAGVEYFDLLDPVFVS